MNGFIKKKKGSWLHRKVFWNVLGWQAMAFVGLYFLFGFIYWLALYINHKGDFNAWDQTLASYSTKALFTIPVYWLVFVKYADWELPKRLATHLFTLPMYLVLWLKFYQVVCDKLGIFYLTGEGLVWDIYIPFLLYFVQFGFIHFYEYVYKSKKQEQAAHALRQAALQSEVNAMKAQLEPHFLFNTLNSISASVPPAMERTRELIAKLADTFRFGLQASGSETVPLREEVNFLKTYMELEKQRFGDRLLPVFQIKENLMDVPVPPMLLQPLVENALKHGVGNSVEPVSVGITVKRVGEKLHFEVSDTGNGNPEGLGVTIFQRGIGLRNTQMRLEKQFDEVLTVRRNKPKGLVFSFDLPLIR